VSAPSLRDRASHDGAPQQRAPHDGAVCGARLLIERVMRGGQPVAAECPLVFAGALERPPGRLVSASRDGQVQSACAVLARDVVCDGRLLRLGLIGYVVTAPEARGRGVGSAVLRRAEQELARAGCTAVLLWADDPAFYRRRGYEAVGAERDLVLDAAAVDALPRWAATRALDLPRDLASTYALHGALPRRTLRSLAEHRALLGIPGMRVRVALRGERVVAYACEGRGADLQGVVHEWAGDALAVLGLQRELGASRLARGLPAFALGPAGPDPVTDAWLDLGLEVHDGILAMGLRLDSAGPGRAAVGPRSRLATGTGSVPATQHLPGARASGRIEPANSPFAGLFLSGLDSI
jgi:GNAT superfamily N-acetyltransferase